MAGGLKHNPLPSLPPTFVGGARVRNVCGITVILYERYTVSKTGSKEIWKSDLTPNCHWPKSMISVDSPSCVYLNLILQPSAPPLLLLKANELQGISQHCQYSVTNSSGHSTPLGGRAYELKSWSYRDSNPGLSLSWRVLYQLSYRDRTDRVPEIPCIAIN